MGFLVLFLLLVQVLFTSKYVVDSLAMPAAVSNMAIFRSRLSANTATRLHSVPLELEGKLTPGNEWEVTFIFEGEEKKVKVPEDRSILESGEEIFDGVDSSCRNGVCTTCAGLVVEGRENTVLAVHGLGKPQIDAGFVCTCQCYPTGPGVVVKLGMYDEVYESQYGQFEKSYDMKYADKKGEIKKGLF